MAIYAVCRWLGCSCSPCTTSLDDRNYVLCTSSIYIVFAKGFSFRTARSDPGPYEPLAYSLLWHALLLFLHPSNRIQRQSGTQCELMRLRSQRAWSTTVAVLCKEAWNSNDLTRRESRYLHGTRYYWFNPVSCRRFCGVSPPQRSLPGSFLLPSSHQNQSDKNRTNVLLRTMEIVDHRCISRTPPSSLEPHPVVVEAGLSDNARSWHLWKCCCCTTRGFLSLSP
ncbi:hypothetical protein VTO42DRAFT_6459 [Malbranchea cinnamomea]